MHAEVQCAWTGVMVDPPSSVSCQMRARAASANRWIQQTKLLWWTVLRAASAHESTDNYIASDVRRPASHKSKMTFCCAGLYKRADSAYESTDCATAGDLGRFSCHKTKVSLRKMLTLCGLPNSGLDAHLLSITSLIRAFCPL